MEPSLPSARPSKLLPTNKRSHRISKSDSLLGTNGDKSSKTSFEFTLARINQTDLATFCPRKLFYIFLVAENDDNSAPTLDDLIEINKTYGEVSSLSFISRDDVLALLKTTDNCNFPNQLKPLLLNIIESVNGQTPENISLILEAQLLKLKLIQIMYQQYVDQVKRNEKEKNLETLLGTLSKECKRKQKKDDHTKEEDEEKNKSPLKDDKNIKKTKKDDKIKGDGKDEEIDYTSIPVDKDGISYEENIFDRIWFYGIKGYYNADIIQCLIDQVSVPIGAIVKFSKEDHISTQSDFLKLFWDHIKQYFFRNTTLYKSLENTIIMHFSPSSTGKEKPLLALEEFVFMLRRIVNLKLTYLKYIRHLKINKIQHTYADIRLECLQQYDRSLRYIPSECVNVESILDALLKEVRVNLDSKNSTGPPSLRSLLLAKSSNKSVYCIDPLHDFDAFANPKRKESNSNNSKNDRFLVHDKDELTKILKSYKYIGPKVVDTTLNLMRRIPAFYGLNDYVESMTQQMFHLHDIDPSTDAQLTSDESIDHFMYLFLFNMFPYKVQLPQSTTYGLLKDLITFNIPQYWNEIQSKVEGDSNNSDREENNIYDISMVHFRWKETLSSDLLLQEVSTASSDFLYMDRKYSPETDNFLIAFSDKLDHFGINTKMVDVVIRTPVCFRDFCRYVLVEEANWLQENKTKIDETTFKVVFDENCPGAHKVKGRLHMFQEYAYLLDGNIKEDIEEDILEQVAEKEGTLGKIYTQGISFSELFTDLQRLSLNLDIVQECENAMEDKEILAYDLGTNLFKVTGKVTTFCSHDNVKVTVDNSGFLQYPDKCTFNVITGDGNVLTIHSRESLLREPYITTLRLKDQSRISFIIRKDKLQLDTCCEVKDNVALSSVPSEKLVIEKSSDMARVEQNLEQDNIHDDSETNVEPMVHCVDEDYIKDLLEGKSLDDLPANEDREDLLQSLLNARENNGIIYKVNPKSCYLKRKNGNLKVPLENAFKNIMSLDNITFKEPKHHQIYTKRFESSQDDKSDLDVKSPIDFRICLPNGLFIRPHPCLVDQNIFMIKQEYAEEKPNVPAVQHEEFRLFSKQGLVLIKKVDGTVTILKANGDVINFEKPSDGSGELNNSLRSCRCSTLEDFRKKLNKLLKNQEDCDFRTSRRGHITSKQNHILDAKILKVLEQFDVPFLKMSITKFDGKRIKIQGDKITQKQLYHLTSQEDFFSGEIFFERNDDFRSMFDRHGSQKNMFPDGTIISNSVDVNDELIDDFVDVKLSYKYKHPYYATVKYNFDTTTEIRLNNGVVIKENFDRNCFTVNLEKDVLISVSSENIFVEKTCQQCKGQFQAHFDVKPFRNGSWNPNEQFMHVKDSYEKHLYSDFVGNCSRNNDYIRGRTNSMKCNHFVKSNYKKLFVMNRDLTGDMFCTNDSVKTKIKETGIHHDASVNTYHMASNENITVVDCRQKVYVNYSDRFYNNSIHPRSDYFKKSTTPRCELYTTFRIFHKMFQSADGIASHISKMNNIFSNQCLDYLGISNVCKNMSNLTNAIDVYHGTYQQELLSEERELIEKKKKQAEELEKKKHILKCSCIKQKLTMEEKMLRWKKQCNDYRKKIKNNDIPTYFKSEFCQMNI